MKNTIFYMPIKSANLAHYFVKGCICPSVYIENRNADVQSKFNAYLLLSSKKFTEDTNCALEIILDTETATSISDNFYILDAVLPICRVKRIFFADEKQKINTVFNITSGAAFLPEHLIAVETSTDAISLKELESVKTPNSKNNWQSKLTMFDKLLGGFAIMNLAKQSDENYSENYFDTLASINKAIGNELKKQSLEISDKHHWAIIKSEKHATLNELIFSTITDNIVMDYAKKQNILIKKENGKYKFEAKDEQSYTYLISILASYGEGTRMSIDDFISHLNSKKFPEKRIEGIGLIFGINKGYAVFRNEYKTQNFQVDVKFRLDSLLDYYTIESMYQYAFNNKITNERFEYLDNWVPKFKNNIKMSKSDTFTVLDKVIAFNEKKKQAQFSNSLHNCFKNSSRGKIYEIIVAEITKSLPPYIVDKQVNAGLDYFKTLLENEFEQHSIAFYNQVSQIENAANEKKYLENEANLNKKIKDLEDENNAKNSEIETLKSELKALKLPQQIKSIPFEVVEYIKTEPMTDEISGQLDKKEEKKPKKTTDPKNKSQKNKPTDNPIFPND